MIFLNPTESPPKTVPENFLETAVFFQVSDIGSM